MDDAPPPRRWRLLTRWLPVGFIECFLTGGVIDKLRRMDCTAEQHLHFNETVAMIVTLLVSVLYPCCQHAAGAARIIDQHVSGLGTGYLYIAVVCIVSLIFSACIAVTQIFTMCLTSTEAELRFHLDTVRVYARLPYLFWVLGVATSVATILLEVLVRYNHLDRGDLTDDGAPMQWSELAPLIASISILFLAVIAWVSLSAGTLYRNLLVLSSDSSTLAAAERISLSHGRAKWFAAPSADDLRSLLDAYFVDLADDELAFSNPSPPGFQRYVLATVRRQGHGDLSYISHRMVESIFEQRIQSILAQSHVEIEANTRLVAAREMK